MRSTARSGERWTCSTAGAEGLKSFDMSERGLLALLPAIWLTLPAYVVSPAFERLRLGLLQPGASLLDNVWLDLVVALGHVAGFLALPVAMIWIARMGSARRRPTCLRHRHELDLRRRHAGAVGAGHALMLLGWAPPGLASLFRPRLRDHLLSGCNGSPPKRPLASPSLPALGIVVLGLVLNRLIGHRHAGLLIWSADNRHR